MTFSTTMVGMVSSLIASIAGIITFAFVNFETKERAKEQEGYYKERIYILDEQIKNMRTDLKDFRVEINNKLDRMLRR